MPSDNTVAVIGAGAWGTALAGVAARAGRDVILYARNAENAAQMKLAHANPRLPGMRLDQRIEITNRIAAAAGAHIILIATPAQNLREAALALAPYLKKATPVIATAKGIERGTHKFMTEVIAEAAPEATPAILSGPSFAEDVARGLPTAVTLAAKDEALASALVQALGSSTFRPYHTTDIRGVEIGGAAKNVLAIAAGIVQGRKLGASALAALDHARLQRVGAARSRLRRARGNPGGAFRIGRSDPELLQPAVAQFCARHCARARRATAARQACGRRVHRTGADRTGGFAKCRYAGIKCGRGDLGRQGDDRCGDRRPADAAVQGGGIVSPRHARAVAGIHVLRVDPTSPRLPGLQYWSGEAWKTGKSGHDGEMVAL